MSWVLWQHFWEHSVPSEDIRTLRRLDRGSIAMWSMSQQGIVGALNNMREDNNMNIVQQLLPCLGEFLWYSVQSTPAVWPSVLLHQENASLEQSVLLLSYKIKFANKWQEHVPLSPHRLSTPHTWNEPVKSCKPELCLVSIINNTFLDADVYTEEWH